MIHSRKILLFLAVAVIGFLIVPNLVFAATKFQLIPDCALGKYNAQRNIYEQEKAPPLSCVEEMLINIAQMILAVSGAIALLMFIYGGFLWMTAAGNPGKVQSGTKIMIGTVIGLVIIFAANLAITAVRNVLVGQGLGASQTQTK